jgi:hypothetical protein
MVPNSDCFEGINATDLFINDFLRDSTTVPTPSKPTGDGSVFFTPYIPNINNLDNIPL